MVGVGDGDRQRVGGVGAGCVAARQQDFQHRRDLPFLGMPCPDDRLLDQVRGIFGDRQPSQGGHHERDAARLPELQRPLRVAVDEGFLDGGLVRADAPRSRRSAPREDAAAAR